jgi:hypothetical protein
VLFNVEIVDDAVIADATTPCGSLSFESLDVAAKGDLAASQAGRP